MQEQECTFLHTGDNTNLNIETCGDSEKCLELCISYLEEGKKKRKHPYEMFDIVSNYSIALYCTLLYCTVLYCTVLCVGVGNTKNN